MKQSYIIAFWNPFPHYYADWCVDIMSSLLHKKRFIQCLNCCDCTSSRSMVLARQADLVVVILQHRFGQVCQYILEDKCMFKEVMYLITDYVQEADWSLERLADVCRVPRGMFVCIPYNMHYRDLSLWRLEKNTGNWRDLTGNYDAGLDFEKEIRHCAFRILKTLEGCAS